MSCEHLVCASCANPVVQGRCTVCRTARADVHESPYAAVTPVVAAVLALLVLAAILAAHLG